MTKKKKKYFPLDERSKVNKLSQKENIYFKVDLKEVWLNVDMVIEEENIVNNKFELKSSPVHFEIKNPIDIDMDYIKDTLADTGLYIWEYRVQGNNEENNYMNNYNIYNEGFNSDNLDYYFLYKLEMKIDNGENRRKARSKSTRKKRNNLNLLYKQFKI